MELSCSYFVCMFHLNMSCPAYLSFRAHLEQTLEAQSENIPLPSTYTDLLQHMDVLIMPDTTYRAVGQLFGSLFNNAWPRPIESVFVCSLAQSVLEWSFKNEVWPLAAWLLCIPSLSLNPPDPKVTPGLLHALVSFEDKRWPTVYSLALQNQMLMSKVFEIEGAIIPLSYENFLEHSSRYMQGFLHKKYLGPGSGMFAMHLVQTYLHWHVDDVNTTGSSLFLSLSHWHPEYGMLNALLHNHYKINRFIAHGDPFELEHIDILPNSYEWWYWHLWLHDKNADAGIGRISAWRLYWNNKQPTAFAASSHFLNVYLEINAIDFENTDPSMFFWMAAIIQAHAASIVACDYQELPSTLHPALE